MSLLAYEITKSQVLVFTDTLATDPAAGTPNMFCSKCVALPHLNMAIAVTGIAQFHSRWVARLQDGLLSRDIVMADCYVPDMLTLVWDELRTTERVPDTATSTIYHFGRSEDSRDYVGYAYRSTAGFASEPLPDGAFGIKPHPIEPFVRPAGLDNVVALAEQIRTEQQARPHGQRVHVGGKLVMTALADDAIIQQTVHTFAGHDAAWNAMNAYRGTDRQPA